MPDHHIQPLERYCAEYGKHSTTRLTEGDWPRCGECGRLLDDHDPRSARYA